MLGADMNTFSASAAHQFVRSAARQRVTGGVGLAETEVETLQSRNLSRTSALAPLFPASVTPFSTIPPSPNLGLPAVFQYHWREYHNFHYNLSGLPPAIGTSPFDAPFGLLYSYFGGDGFFTDSVFRDAEPLGDYRLGLGCTAYISYRAATTTGGTAPAEEWCVRRSRFRTSRTYSCWFGRCELTEPNPGEYHIANVVVMSQFTTVPFVFVEVPFLMDTDPEIGDNVAVFAIIGESPEQWSARTGIPIT